MANVVSGIITDHLYCKTPGLRRSAEEDFLPADRFLKKTPVPTAQRGYTGEIIIAIVARGRLEPSTPRV
jgi:hypothetical protein